MQIEKYSFGIGDRFAKEGEAQLSSIQEINNLGTEVIPVWNKSFREHQIVKTTQFSVKNEADESVQKQNWKKSYYVDADHIGIDTVDEFIDYSNFFTIDVAHFISKPVDLQSKSDFINRYKKYLGKLSVSGIPEKFEITEAFLSATADKYLSAIREVAKIYKYIESKKGADNFIPEVSMDETDKAQTPLDLLFILAELHHKGVKVQTIAPKFTGLFAKGIDYIGDLDVFAREFEQDVAVVRHAIENFGLPDSLKISMHSGSDKFSLYPVIRNVLSEFDTGIHVKTAGTTWLEEVTGLAMTGGKGLDIARRIYSASLHRYEELTAPYESVLSIRKANLPEESDVNDWTGEQFVSALQHDKNCKDFNPDFRQLIHVGYKTAVEMGDEFKDALTEYHDIIAEQVKYNLLERHLKPLFLF
ncbi:MAG: hypothetical protein JXB24_07770 [Bacteroidales bacterium]|nr:hypothetical protein [Bacteroidales bacterium]